jgi:hypothetical protein
MSVTYVCREESFVLLEVGPICKKEQNPNFRALQRNKGAKTDVSDKKHTAKKLYL